MKKHAIVAALAVGIMAASAAAMAAPTCPSADYRSDWTGQVTVVTCHPADTNHPPSATIFRGRPPHMPRGYYARYLGE